MNWNRITIKGRAYIIEVSAATEKIARKRAAQMGCKVTSKPSGKGFLIIRPTGVFGLPEEPATDSPNGAGRLQASAADAEGQS